jgi:hypothetical protein
MELIAREIPYPDYIAFGFLLSLGVLVISKLLAPNFLTYLLNIIFSAQPLSTTAYSDKFSVRQGRALLLLNFLFVSLCAMEIIRFEFGFSFQILFLFAPVLYFCYLFGMLYFAHFLTGDNSSLNAQRIVLIGVFQIAGIVAYPIVIVWYLNPNLSHILWNVLIVIFGLFIAYRIVRGFFIGLSKQVSWYYLILYLCTAEIYPILMIYAINIGI